MSGAQPVAIHREALTCGKPFDGLLGELRKLSPEQESIGRGMCRGSGHFVWQMVCDGRGRRESRAGLQQAQLIA